MNQDPPSVSSAFSPRAKEPYWRRIGGGSLGLSVLVHLLMAVIALLLIRVVVPKKVEPERFQTPGGSASNSSVTQTQLVKKRKAVTHSTPKSRLTVPTSTSLVLLDEKPVEFMNPSMDVFSRPSGGNFLGKDGLKASGGIGGGNGPGSGPGNAPGLNALPTIFRGRCAPAERAEKMRANGGNEACERAVVNTLDWLKSKQNPNGSWGTTHRAGITGLVLLAFYGHCETPDSPFYGTSVTSGVTYLTDLGMKHDGFLSEQAGTNMHCTYEHGIACYALGETYAFAKLGRKQLPLLRETFEDGVKLIVAHQLPNGAWAYAQSSNSYGSTGEDLSVTGWQFQALKAATHTKLRIAGLDKAITKSVAYLESKQLLPDGGFGRKDGQRGQAYSQYTMTGIGVLGLQTLSSGHAGKAGKGLRFLEGELARDPLDWKNNANLYCWYYNTQAFFQKGGKPWQAWNDQCREQILSHQNPDGSYAKETGNHGAATSAAAGADADLYRACLCTLMLEVYYRYLKVGGSSDSNPHEI